MRRIVLPLMVGCCLAAAVAGQVQNERHGVSVIVAETRAQADSLRDQIRSGASFEALAMKYSSDATAAQAGYMGIGTINLRPEFQAALVEVPPGAISAVTRVGDRFAFLKLATPAEDSWRSLHIAATEALRNGRFTEAESLFVSAVAKSRELRRDDVRLAESLNGLARTCRYQGNYASAESNARESLAILEQALGGDHPGVIDSLVNLVATAQFQGRYADAESIYRRILALRWRGPTGGSVTVVDVLEDFATVLSLSYSEDGELDGALRHFRQALAQAPLHKDLYLVMRDGLVTARLEAEAEALMEQAVRIYPDSRQLRFQLADLYVKSSKYQKALEVFEAASRIPAHPDPDVDRVQRSLTFTKIAEMYMFLVRFDSAFGAIRTALDIHPTSVEARVTSANLHFLRNRLEESAAEYALAILAHPDSVNAHYGLAQLNLSRGHFMEAAASAAKALEIDSSHQQSRYVLAMALIRGGKDQEGRKTLQEYQRREETLKAQELQKQEVSEFERRVTAKVREGQLEAAAVLLQDGIRLHPAARTLYVKLGLIQSRMRLHREAIATFQKMIQLTLDDFLVHKSLYREYELVDDIPASLRHRVIYLQKYDAALNEKLN